jgi:hypothetical protein
MVGAMWSNKTKIEHQQGILRAIQLRKFEQGACMIG